MSELETLRYRLVNSLELERTFNERGFTDEQINYLVSLVNEVVDKVSVEPQPGNQLSILPGE